LIELTSKLLEKISEGVYSLVLKSVTRVPSDVQQSLSELKSKEQKNAITSAQLDLMLQNLAYGKEQCLPLCQDTGTQNFFIQIGERFPVLSDFKKVILIALAKLTDEGKIRPNTVDPFTQKNQLHNGGTAMPPIYLEIIPDRDDLIITVLSKGGGAENISKLFMLSASTGLSDLPPLIDKTLSDAGGNPCPPVILGIGIGGDAVKAMYLAKKALLRPMGSINSRTEVAQLEEEILDRVNKLPIGIMGLGGNSNCLDVRIEWAMRHPASFPVGLIVQCYCHRSLSLRVDNQGNCTFGKLTTNFDFEEDEE